MFFDDLLEPLAQVSIFLSKDSISATIIHGAFIDLNQDDILVIHLFLAFLYNNNPYLHILSNVFLMIFLMQKNKAI